ncbi:MAG: ribbon-helix-helix domain-containing protein [Ferroplasma sp.]|uniref:ribbon-helix-helix domain-containing protein n=1 Tax=Ferroplasma sp. TaxID=2591003 RepID=UPI002814C560|nr:ribbon-helix-helix domain-containing protein [Ferroplasma sp.]WMT51302.1 MAG: ribbon-helix-helix domain-containing protein [Ferroplasma sp.]
MSVPYRITIRVSEDLIDQLQEIVEKNHYSSISEAIRLAISEFISKNHANSTSKVDLKLPRNIYAELEEEVNNGNAISVNDLIRFILREYAKGKTKN